MTADLSGADALVYDFAATAEIRDLPASPVPLFDLDPSLVRIPQDRIRTDHGDVEELAASMAETGLVNPIVIDRDRNLVAGERRLLAARLLGWPKILVRVIDASLAEGAELAENGHRKPFTPEEIGEWADRHWDDDLGGQKGDRRDLLARRIGVSGVQLERCRRIVRRVRENPELRDVLQTATSQGAKAAEREILDRTERSKPRLESLGLHDAEPLALLRMDGVRQKARVVVTHEPRSHVPSDIVRGATLALGAAGTLLLSLDSRQIEAALGVIDDSGLVHFAGFEILVAGAESRLYVRATNIPGTPVERNVRAARTLQGAAKAMLAAHSGEGDLIVDPYLGDGLHALAADRRRFVGADLDPANLERVRGML